MKTSWWTCRHEDKLVGMQAGRQAGGHAEEEKTSEHRKQDSAELTHVMCHVQ